MALKCSNCGAENADTAKYCQMCATFLEPTRKAPGWLDRKISVESVVVIAVVCAIVILAGFVGIYYVIPPRTIVVTNDISLAYSWYHIILSPGNPDDGNIEVLGNIYNGGNTAALCNLSYNMMDSRGWSMSDSFGDLRVRAGSSHSFFMDYAWPGTYNGISLHVGNVTNTNLEVHFTDFHLTASKA